MFCAELDQLTGIGATQDAAQQFDATTRANMIVIAQEYRQAEKNTPPVRRISSGDHRRNRKRAPRTLRRTRPYTATPFSARKLRKMPSSMDLYSLKTRLMTLTFSLTQLSKRVLPRAVRQTPSLLVEPLRTLALVIPLVALFQMPI